MRQLDLNEDLVLTDGTFRVVEQQGTKVRLLNLATGERVMRELADVYARLSEPPRTSPSSPRALDALTAVDRKKVLFWAAHIEEMSSGRPTPDTQPRPEYNPGGLLSMTA